MVATQAKYGPHAKEANDGLNESGGCALDGLNERLVLATQNQIGYVAAEYKQRVY